MKKKEKDDTLESLLKGLKYKNCSKSNLSVKYYGFQNGFQCEVQIVCSARDFVHNKCKTSSCANGSIEIKELITDAFLDMGAGYSGVYKFSSELNMEIMRHKTFAKYIDKAHKKSVKLSEHCPKLVREVV